MEILPYPVTLLKQEKHKKLSFRHFEATLDKLFSLSFFAAYASAATACDLKSPSYLVYKVGRSTRQEEEMVLE